MSIDKRIVQMEFDNAQFERGTRQSVESIERLKKSLEMEKSIQSFERMNAITTNVNLDSIASSMEDLVGQFNGLGLVGNMVLARLTDSVINFGKKLWSEYIKPMTTGFQEYETQMNAVQTILANTESKGTTLDDVTAALGELNTYADQTIYNFTEMTRNIGTFTAAGIDLDTSVSAIKGIANLAAVSGSNAQQASTAMYQLSQALSSGTLKLQDWNSVVNAGMGGQIFQDALKETAKVHGVKIDAMIKKEGSFRETLKSGWITSAILTETLAKFTGDLNEEQLKSIGYTEEQIEKIIRLGDMANDAATKVKTFTQLKDTLAEAMQSGWTQSWQIVLGDFEEAKKLFTEVSDRLGALIAADADARNNILQAWKDWGGRGAIISALRAAFDALLKIMVPIKEAFSEIFPIDVLDILKKFTRQITLFAQKIVWLSQSKNLEKIKRIFMGLFSALDIGRQIIVEITGRLAKFLKTLLPTGSSVLDFLANMGDYLTNFRNSIDITKGFDIALAEVGKVLEKVKGYFNQAAKSVQEFWKGLVNSVDFLKEWFPTISENLNADGFKQFFTNIIEGARSFLTSFKAKLGEFRAWFDGIFANVDLGPIKNFFEKIKGRLKDFEELGKSIGGFIQKAIDKISELGEAYKKMITEKIEASGFKAKLESIKKNITDGIAWIGKTISDAMTALNFDNSSDLINTGIGAAFFLSIKGFLSKGSDGIKSVEGVFKSVQDVIKGFSEIFGGVTGVLEEARNSLKTWQQQIKSKTLMTIASAVALLTVSLIALSFVDSKKLTIALAAVTGLFANLMSSLAIYNKVSGPTSGAGGLSAVLITLATSILILSFALSILSKIEQDDLVTGLEAIGAMTAGILVFSKLMSQNAKDIMKGTAGFIAFSFSLLMLVGVIKLLGMMDTKELTQGLMAVGILLSEIALFTQLSSLDKTGVSSGLGLVAIAGAIYILQGVVEKFGEMDKDKAIQGLQVMGGILAEIAIFTRLSGSPKNVVGTAISVVIISGAMMILAEAISRLGNMTTEEVKTGLIAMAGSLAAIVLALRLMPKNTLGSAISLAIVSASLLLMAEALTKIGALEISELQKGLIGIGGSIAILVVGLNGMTGTLAGSAALLVAVGALMLLVPVIAALGQLSLLQIGTALLAIAGVFVVLGIAGTVLTPLVPVIFSLAGALLLLGGGMALIGLGLVLFSAGLAALAVSGTAGALAIVGIVSILLGAIPMIIAAVVGGLVLFGKMVIALIPVIAEIVKQLILAAADIVIKTAPKLFEALTVLLKGLLKTIREVVPDFVDTVLFLVGRLLKSLAEKVPEFVQSGIDLILGVLKGIRDNIAEITIVAIEIVTEFINAVAEKLPDIIDSGFNLVISFINGLADSITENGPELQEAVVKLGTAIVTGFKNGITAGVGGVVSAIQSLAGAAIEALKTLLGIFSPSRVFEDFGENTTLGYSNGIINMLGTVSKATKKVGDIAKNSMSEALGRISDSLDGNMELNPTIRPVLDLAEVLSGSKTLNGLLNGRSFDIAGIQPKVGQSIQEINPNKSPVGATINFEQNNYSPEALSRLEIYRQTKNLLQGAKGLV